MKNLNKKVYTVEDAELRYTKNLKTEQSANTIFNFMQEAKFLYKILLENAITPRYNFEIIDYLKIFFKKIAFPMTCFCDINLHKIKLHTATYGEYGIAFNKDWGINNKIQPIHYVNINSLLIEDFNKAYNDAEKIDIPENIYVEQLSDYMLSHLLYMKPLNGYMLKKSGERYKNFQDESEWRYIPNFSCTNVDLDLIYSENTTQAQLDEYNLALNIVDECKLKFSYKDIKYLVVPNEEERTNLIKFIMSLKESKDENEKYQLISKIIVLSELEEDV